MRESFVDAWIWCAIGCCALACASATGLVLREAAARSDDWVATGAPDSESARMAIRLPALWRAGWPLMLAFAPLGRLIASERVAARATFTLSKASMPAMVRPEHLVVARLLCVVFYLAVVLFIGVPWLMASGDVLQPISYLSPTAAVGALAIARVPDLWLNARAKRRRYEIERQLPFFLDLLALCVQAGLNVRGALVQATRHGQHGVLCEEIERVLAEIRAGQERLAAFSAFARRSDSPSVQAWVAAMAQAEALGMSLGDQLREQATAQSAARFERAEQRAMQAPVKMLLPLMVFIFPCTFVVIGFPIAMSMRGAFF